MACGQRASTLQRPSLWGGAGSASSKFLPQEEKCLLGWDFWRFYQGAGKGCALRSGGQAAHLRWECRWQGQSSPAGCPIAQGLSLPHTLASCLRVSERPREERLHFFLFLFKFFKLIYLFLAAPALRCCVWAFSGCSEQGLLSSCGARASRGGGFSLFQSMGSSVMGIRSCGLWA